MRYTTIYRFSLLKKTIFFTLEALITPLLYDTQLSQFQAKQMYLNTYESIIFCFINLKTNV